MPLDAITGSGRTRLGFPDLDLKFHLKVRAYLELCMNPAFAELARRVDLYGLRESGIYPIMYYLAFRPTATALRFASPVRTDFAVRLHRYRPPAAGPASGAPAEDRLLMDWRCELFGVPGSGRPEEMTPPPDDAETSARVGSGRVVQVVTRPLAPAGQRQVREIPEPYRILEEHPWAEPYPTWQSLSAVPAGFAPEPEIAPGAGVWGLANTDINQHVNVNEYVAAAEAHQVQALAEAGQPPAEHFVTAADMVFHKPCFPGQAFRVVGRLYRHGEQTLYLGGIHLGDGEPAPDVRPAVFIRFEGHLGAPGA